VSDKLATSMGPRSDPSTDMRPDAPRKCIGCGGVHGSVNVSRICLEQHLIAARIELEPLKSVRGELLALKAMREENRNAAPSWVEKNRRGKKNLTP
jgi:hypothetical protein